MKNLNSISLLDSAIYAIRSFIRTYEEGDENSKPVSAQDVLEDAKRSEEAFMALFNTLSNLTPEEEREELYNYCFKKFYGDDKGLASVGIYDRVQECGGSEEGGWYYDNYHYNRTEKMAFELVEDFINKTQDESRVYGTAQIICYLELVPDMHGKYEREYYS